MAKFDAHLKCSFCGKSQDQVRKLIAGPGVYICDECIDLCNVCNIFCVDYWFPTYLYRKSRLRSAKRRVKHEMIFA